LRAFNLGLQKLKKNGGLKKILDRHGLYTQENNPAPSKKDIQKERKSLVIGTVNNSDMHILQQLSKEYNHLHPEVDIIWRTLDEHTLRKRLLSDLAIEDSQYDIMTIGPLEISILAKRGWLTPINNLPQSYNVEDIIPSIRNAVSEKGQLYALPFYGESSMTYYLRDLFDTAGLHMPAIPNYADIEHFEKKIHNPAEGIYGICLRGKPGWGENMAFITPMVNAFGGRWFSNSWQAELDSQAWLNALLLYKKLLTNYGPPHPENNGFNENLQLFSQGKCGIWIDATVAAGYLFNPEHSIVHKDVGFASAPKAITEKGSFWLWTWALAIPSSSNNKKAAQDFITWATSPEYSQKVVSKYGWIAAPPGTRLSTYNNKKYQEVAPFSPLVFDAIKKADIHDATLEKTPYTGIQYVNITSFPAIGDQVGLQMVKILKGETTVAKGLIKSNHIVNQQLQRSHHQ
jgi:sorbitol/mannitol transport system substrate-binding protein